MSNGTVGIRPVSLFTDDAKGESYLPMDLFLSSNDVDEDATVGTSIGVIYVTGGKPPHFFSITSDPSGLLSLNGDELLVDGSLTGLSSYDFQITVTDNIKNYAETFTLNIVDVVENDSGIDPGDGEIVLPDPEDPETDQGGFVNPPIQQTSTEGLKVTGKNGGTATWFKSLPIPDAGESVLFSYSADWSGMNRSGREAAVGFAFKAGNQYHLTGIRGDGGSPASMRASRIHGDFRKANQFTITDDAAASGTVKDGPNFLRLIVSEDGETYSIEAGASADTMSTIQTGRVPTPIAGVDDTLEFGIGGYFTNTDKGVFSITITLYQAATGPYDILLDNTTIAASAAVGTVVGNLSALGGIPPYTFELVESA